MTQTIITTTITRVVSSTTQITETQIHDLVEITQGIATEPFFLFLLIGFVALIGTGIWLYTHSGEDYVSGAGN